MEKIILEITVRPSSRTFGLKRIMDEYEFFTPEPARGGKANASLIKYLKRELKADEVKIVRGLKDRRKVVVIHGERVRERLTSKFKREGQDPSSCWK